MCLSPCTLASHPESAHLPVIMPSPKPCYPNPAPATVPAGSVWPAMQLSATTASHETSAMPAISSTPQSELLNKSMFHHTFHVSVFGLSHLSSSSFGSYLQGLGLQNFKNTLHCTPRSAPPISALHPAEGRPLKGDACWPTLWIPFFLH